MTRSVLMFCPQFRPIVGGAERQAEKLSRTLVQLGVRVTILTPRFYHDSPLYEEDHGLVIRRFPLFDLCKRLPWARGLGPMNLLLLWMQIRKAVSGCLQGVDIVHMHIASPLTAFAMRIAKQEDIPVLCKVAMAGERSDLDEITGIGMGGKDLAEMMVRDLTCWVATTEAVQKTFLRWGIQNSRMALIPNGVELVCSRILRKNGLAKRFLHLGRLSTNIQRDVPTLVRAFDRLADRVTDAELALVGNGDLYQDTAALVAQTRNKQRIRMPGQQSPEPWLQWADCLVLPSRREGLSNALLEAMAHGLACIANDIPPNREVLNHGNAGVLVPVGDENQLLNEMHRVATEAGLADRLGNAALQRVRERYSIEAVAEQYLELYEQLLKKHPKGENT